MSIGPILAVDSHGDRIRAVREAMLELIRRQAPLAELVEIRKLWTRHSIAEDNRDLPGLLATLAEDCVYELVQSGHRWEGREGAARFYDGLFGGFPDIEFHLRDIVIGPQGICQEADITATHEGEWLGIPPSRTRLTWRAAIFFPWNPARRLFKGERVYTAGLPLPPAA
jgi:predicted ester cyclase